MRCSCHSSFTAGANIRGRSNEASTSIVWITWSWLGPLPVNPWCVCKHYSCLWTHHEWNSSYLPSDPGDTCISWQISSDWLQRLAIALPHFTDTSSLSRHASKWSYQLRKDQDPVTIARELLSEPQFWQLPCLWTSLESSVWHQESKSICSGEPFLKIARIGSAPGVWKGLSGHNVDKRMVLTQKRMPNAMVQMMTLDIVVFWVHILALRDKPNRSSEFWRSTRSTCKTLFLCLWIPRSSK